MTDEMRGLIERIEAGERSNALDVLIEVALFEPSENWKAARPNAAKTKVIYTDRNGVDATHWAPDWSTSPAALSSLRAASLRALSTIEGHGDEA